ncbi:MAG: hypothetical protein ABIN61_02530 [candidate division WOR-3 bacterium]
MFELLFLTSYVNISKFSDELYYRYYRNEVSEAPILIRDVILANYYYNGYYLYSEGGESFSLWGEKLLEEKFGILLYGEIKKSLRKSSKVKREEGLIPDIELELKMPRGLSYILGEGGEIKVKGSQSIDLRLEQTKNTYSFQEALPSYSYPQIILEQRLKANVDGTIGTKLNVEIDHDSERSEQENDLKIWYGGRSGMDTEIEDEIIQELHLGDVGSMGGDKLFGISTRGQFGSTTFDLNIGKLETDEVSGSDYVSVSSQTIIRNERDYVDGFYYTGLKIIPDSIIEYGLFASVGGDFSGIPTSLFEFNGEYIGEARFLELEKGKDYELRELLISGKRRRLPYFRIINLGKIIDGRTRLGVYIIYADSTGKIDTLGGIKRDPTDPKRIESLTLYQLRSPNPTPSDPSWWLRMRNVYSFGKGEEGPFNLRVDIYKIISGGNDEETNDKGIPYAQILGINKSKGLIDPNQVLWEDGCIIFPEPYPFLNPELGSDTVPEIYRKSIDLFPEIGKKYKIVITTTSSIRSFTLKGMKPIVEGSEVLTVEGGRTLQKGIDYTINYYTGEVELKEGLVLPPDAKIRYSFKSQPLLSFKSQYRSKLNLQSNFIKDGKLNFDLQFLSRSDKGVFRPVVGKEPSNIASGKLDFSLRKEPEFLSDFFSKMPFVDDKSKSGFAINGNYGFSLPNPASNGKSYLDDMESINLSLNIGLEDFRWSYSSVPNGNNINNICKIDWFTDRYYYYSRIFPAYSEASFSENRTSVLVLYFQPKNVESWGGIMQAFTRAQNFSKKDFLEIWIKGDGGEFIFEMGSRMAEDAPRWGKSSSGLDSLIQPNGILDKEDKNGDGLLQAEEDCGLDGVRMNDENWFYRPDTLYDEGVDDYYGKGGSFKDSLKSHNKEGNGRLDSEDLNGDFILEKNNDYFRYKIDLSSQKYLSKEGLNGWKVFIIPLRDSSCYEKIGNPSFDNIVYTRIWLRGFRENTRITIAKIEAVGNEWLNKGVHFALSDSLNPEGGSFIVGYRNTREDPGYVSPVEMEPIYGMNTYEREQSLSFKIDFLKPNNYCLIEKYLELDVQSYGEGYDFRLYKNLNFYTKFIGDSPDSILVFIRLATDSANYYQYTTNISQKGDWDTLWVNFDKFTELKANNETRRGEYSLKGNPSLKNISYLQLGVLNKGSTDVKGEVLIDDIILTGADKRRGDLINLSLSGNCGDLLPNVSYQISKQSSNYKSNLSELRSLGDREDFSQGFGLTANIGNFLGDIVNCPITVNLREAKRIPVYRVNSDVLLNEEERNSLAEKSEGRDITFSISKKTKSKNWFLRNTIDNLKLSGSNRRSENFSPFKRADTTVSSAFSANYSLDLPRLSFPIFGDKNSSLLPKKLDFGTNYEWKETAEYSYKDKDSLYERKVLPITKQIRSSASVFYNPIRWIEANYSISFKNDLREKEAFSQKFSLKDLGQDALLTENLNLSHRSSQFGVNNLNLTYKVDFNQNHEIEYSKSLGDSLDVRSCSRQKTVRFDDDLKLGNFLEKIPGLSKISRNISPLKFSYNFSKSGSFAYLSAKPNFKFRYGIEDNPEENLFVDFSNRDGGKINKSYSISSGFSLWRIKVDIKGRLTENEPDDFQLKRNPQEARKNSKLTFPEISLDISDIQKYIPYFSNYLKRASFSLYVTKDSSYERSIVDQTYSSGKSSLSITPGLNFSLKNDLGIGISPNYTSRRDFPPSNLNGYTTSKGVKVSFSYQIRPSKTGSSFPLLGRIKWETPISLNASFNFSDNESYYINSLGNKSVNTDNKTVDFNINGSYSFSEMVTGGLLFNYRNYFDERLKISSSTFGGGINVIINF